MKIKIVVTKVGDSKEEFGGLRFDKAFIFECDPVEMARYRTAATVKRKIEEYVAMSGVFRDEELKNLNYDMKEFNKVWNEEVKKIKMKEKEEEEEIKKKIEEIKMRAERYQQAHQAC